MFDESENGNYNSSFKQMFINTLIENNKGLKEGTHHYNVSLDFVDCSEKSPKVLVSKLN